MSRPDKEMPQDWDEIPGARGCTPQSCAFRDHHAELRSLGARVFGLSAQGTEYQREAAQRLRLPFELLSDEELAFCEGTGFAGVRSRGHHPAQETHARRQRRANREGLLSCVPAQRKREGSYRMAFAEPPGGR